MVYSTCFIFPGGNIETPTQINRQTFVHHIQPPGHKPLLRTKRLQLLILLLLPDCVSMCSSAAVHEAPTAKIGYPRDSPKPPTIPDISIVVGKLVIRCNVSPTRTLVVNAVTVYQTLISSKESNYYSFSSSSLFECDEENK